METSRINFPGECEQTINNVIKTFWSAEQTYAGLSSLCALDEIAMLGFSEYFRLCYLRMRSCADKLINFQTVRGGRLTFGEVHNLISLPSGNELNIEKFIRIAYDMEKRIEESLLELYNTAKSKNDVVTSEFIECGLLKYQIQILKTTVNHLNGLLASENVWIYDTLTMKPFVSKIYSLTKNFSTSNCSTFSQTDKQNSQYESNMSINNEEEIKSFINCWKQ